MSNHNTDADMSSLPLAFLKYLQKKCSAFFFWQSWVDFCDLHLEKCSFNFCNYKTFTFFGKLLCMTQGHNSLVLAFLHPLTSEVWDLQQNITTTSSVPWSSAQVVFELWLQWESLKSYSQHIHTDGRLPEFSGLISHNYLSCQVVLDWYQQPHLAHNTTQWQLWCSAFRKYILKKNIRETIETLDECLTEN